MAFRILALWEYGRVVKTIMRVVFPLTAIGASASIALAIRDMFGASLGAVTRVLLPRTAHDVPRSSDSAHRVDIMDSNISTCTIDRSAKGLSGVFICMVRPQSCQPQQR